jgi:hypothetical protein
VRSTVPASSSRAHRFHTRSRIHSVRSSAHWFHTGCTNCTSCSGRTNCTGCMHCTPICGRSAGTSPYFRAHSTRNRRRCMSEAPEPSGTEASSWRSSPLKTESRTSRAMGQATVHHAPRCANETVEILQRDVSRMKRPDVEQSAQRDCSDCPHPWDFKPSPPIYLGRMQRMSRLLGWMEA